MHAPLVLSGEVKVSRHSSDGRSLELDRVVPGELCLVSGASLIDTLAFHELGTVREIATLILRALASALPASTVLHASFSGWF